MNPGESTTDKSPDEVPSSSNCDGNGQMGTLMGCVVGGRLSWQGLQRVLECRELYGTVPAKGVLALHDIFEYNRNRQTLWQRDLKGHTGCVNAVEFSPTEEFIVSGGDDCNVQVWRTLDAFVQDKPRPFLTMATRHFSNIFALRFSLHTERLYSGANDHQLIVHDIATRGKTRIYRTVGAYYRIATHPTNDHVIAAASESSRLHIYDLREKSSDGMGVGHADTFYSVEYSPQNPNLLAACGNPSGLCIYDMRKPDERYARADKKMTREAICADFSPDGKALFCVVQRRQPLYFDLELSTCVEMKDPGYANLSTIKSCTFAGPDYVLSGSDEWNIYAWRTPPSDDIKAWGDLPMDKAYTVLRGHRSVVNHVRYSPKNSVLLSCGVEKIVKCWSHVELRNAYRNPQQRERNARMGLRLFHPPMDDMDGEGAQEDSLEEDLATLHQFDFYHQQALAQREGRGDRRQRLLDLLRAYDDDGEGGNNNDGDDSDDGEENPGPLFPRVVVFPNEDDEDDSDVDGGDTIRVGDDVMMFMDSSSDSSNEDENHSDQGSSTSSSSHTSGADSNPTTSIRSHSSSRLDDDGGGGGGGSTTMMVDDEGLGNNEENNGDGGNQPASAQDPQQPGEPSGRGDGGEPSTQTGRRGGDDGKKGSG